jgi:hypothetical protein
MPRRVTATRPAPAGRRDKATAIDQMVATTGDSGFPVETWALLVSPYWCERVDVEGSEALNANQITAPIRTMWTGPYRPDLDPELVDVARVRRLRYQGRVYDILTGFLTDRRAGIQLLTLARVG